MDQEQQVKILYRARSFFREELVHAHINGACKRAGKLSEYNVNPFLFKYLANFLRGNDNPRSIAEALIYPRILGASITTSFGMRLQKLMGILFQGMGSTTPGIDIEFVDAVDGRKKYCQVKSGPNTINHDDVDTVLRHFRSTINLARTNNLTIGINDMIVGVIYGEPSDLSGHYVSINETHPVIIGQEFWHRLTGNPNFYFDLIEAFGEVALDVDGSAMIEEAVQNLSLEIAKKFPR